MSGREINGNPRFNYRERTRDERSGNWRGALISGSIEDGRDAQLSGVKLKNFATSINQELESSSASYFKIESVPSWTTLEAGGDHNYAVLIRTE